MKSEISNPHDRFFKAVFSKEEHARDFLQLYLPQEISALIDFTTLSIVKDSFIEKELREYFSDLLYQVDLKGQTAFIYCLFEHKSSPDKLTAYQLLRYMVRIWGHLVQQGQIHTRLPIIVPVVIYHGRTRWQVSCEFRDLFQLPDKSLESFAPDFRYLLYDISHVSDDDIKGAVILQATFLIMKYIFHPELGKHLEKIFQLLSALTEKETGLEYLETILRYIVHATDNISEKDLQKAVKNIPKGDKVMPTIAEQWEKKGFEKGMEKGIQQGMQQGMQQGIREGLLEAIELGLKLKFGARGLKLYAGIRKIEEVEQLRSIKEAIEVAKDLREIEELL